MLVRCDGEIQHDSDMLVRMPNWEKEESSVRPVEVWTGFGRG